MRLPCLAAALSLATVFTGPGTASHEDSEMLRIDRADAGVRDAGLVARGLALDGDGTLRVWSPAGWEIRPLGAAARARLARLSSEANLAALPQVVESRARWFDLREASTTLVWGVAPDERATIEADLRPGSADRALAPHGVVELLEALEETIAAVPPARIEPPAAWDVRLELLDGNEPANLYEVFAGDVEPLAWPAATPEPADAAEPGARADGAAGWEFLEAARQRRPVAWAGRTWNVLVRPLPPAAAVTDRARAGS